MAFNILSAINFVRKKKEESESAEKKSSFWKLTLLGLLLSVALPQGALFYAGAYGEMPDIYTADKRVSYKKDCMFRQPGTEDVITGRREYTYLASSLFGYQFHDPAKVEEKTFIDVKGSAMTLIGTSVDPSLNWNVQVGMGEQGHEQIAPADRLAIVVHSETRPAKVFEFSYLDFCK